MHAYLDKKCLGITMIIAGVILGAIAFGVWSSWLNLTLFFAIIAVVIGLHALMCECGAECYEPVKTKPKKR